MHCIIIMLNNTIWVFYLSVEDHQKSVLKPRHHFASSFMIASGANLPIQDISPCVKKLLWPHFHLVCELIVPLPHQFPCHTPYPKTPKNWGGPQPYPLPKSWGVLYIIYNYVTVGECPCWKNTHAKYYIIDSIYMYSSLLLPTTQSGIHR